MKKQIITLSIAFIFWMIAIHPDDMKIRIQGSSSTNALKTLMDAYEYLGYVTFIVSEENIADIYKSIRISYGTWDNVHFVIFFLLIIPQNFSNSLIKLFTKLGN